MRALIAALLLAMSAGVQAGTVVLGWGASDCPWVAGYRVYWGTSSRSYTCATNSGTALLQALDLPSGGRWFFAVTAIATNGLESDFSNEAQWEERPGAPVLGGEAVVRLAPVIERSTNLVDWFSVTGAPTFLLATNRAEFFRSGRLIVEDVRAVGN